MSAHDTGGKFGFLDSLTRIFRGREETREVEAPANRPLEALEADFEGVVGELRERIEVLRGEGPGRRKGDTEAMAEARDASRQERIAQIHQRIRGEIEAMHARLGSGIKGGDLDPIIEELKELEVFVSEGRMSHELLPRARYAIAERLRKEAGALAVGRLGDLLTRAEVSWPDPTHYRPGASEEEIERSRRRRLQETREAFLTEGFERTAQRAVGIVSGWGSDYPDPGSPLWEECVLEGVAAGIRGQLTHEFVEILQRDRDVLSAEIEQLVGKEVAELHKVLQAGVTSITLANRAVAGALQAIDLVTPDVAWRHLHDHTPHARAEWDD